MLHHCTPPSKESGIKYYEDKSRTRYPVKHIASPIPQIETPLVHTIYFGINSKKIKSINLQTLIAIAKQKDNLEKEVGIEPTLSLNPSAKFGFFQAYRLRKQIESEVRKAAKAMDYGKLSDLLNAAKIYNFIESKDKINVKQIDQMLDIIADNDLD